MHASILICKWNEFFEEELSLNGFLALFSWKSPYQHKRHFSLRKVRLLLVPSQNQSNKLLISLISERGVSMKRVGSIGRGKCKIDFLWHYAPIKQNPWFDFSA
jgi:hypothetical protein